MTLPRRKQLRQDLSHMGLMYLLVFLLILGALVLGGMKVAFDRGSSQGVGVPIQDTSQPPFDRPQ